MCYDEYNYFGGSTFINTNVDVLIAGTVKDADDQAMNGYQWLYDTVYIAHFGLNVWDSIQAWNGHNEVSNWANFDFAFNASQGLARALMFSDKVFKVKVMQTKKPWMWFWGAGTV